MLPKKQVPVFSHKCSDVCVTVSPPQLLLFVAQSVFHRDPLKCYSCFAATSQLPTLNLFCFVIRNEEAITKPIALTSSSSRLTIASQEVTFTPSLKVTTALSIQTAINLKNPKAFTQTLTETQIWIANAQKLQIQKKTIGKQNTVGMIYVTTHQPRVE